MTLPEILKAVRQWWWILVICPVLAVVVAYFVSSSITPVYEAEATVIIEHQMLGGGSDLASIQAAERRIRTFTQLVETRTVLSAVLEDLDLDMSPGELRANVSARHTRDTQLLRIAVQDHDPEQAARIANRIAQEFAEFVRITQAPVFGDMTSSDLDQDRMVIQEQMDATIADINELEAAGQLSAEQQRELDRLQLLHERLEQAHATLLILGQTLGETEGSVGSQVFIVELAAAPDSPVSPRVMLNTALAGVLGILLGGGLIVGAAYLDDRVKSAEEIRRVIQRPVIGSVPIQAEFEPAENMSEGRSMSGEIFRGIRTNLQFTMVDRDVKSIVVTSMRPEEGKSTVAANLAIVLAQGGQRVILVDADMRRPRIHSMFNKVRNDRGVSNLLLQSPSVLENVVQSTSIKNLKVLATGPLPPNPPDLFGSTRMKSLVNALEASADIVVFDSPPVAISESLLLASLVDGIVFVVRAGRIRKGELVDSMESLNQTGATILGIVINGIDRQSQANYRVYQQYYSLGTDNSPTPPPSRGLIGRLFGRS